MRPDSIWAVLGLEITRERAAIRKAYAGRLKATNPEDDPEGFKTLREAYEAALFYADSGYDEQALDDEWPESIDEEPQAWGGPPPPTSDDSLSRACMSLEAALGGDGDLDAALAAVLTSPVLDQAGPYVQTEVWLASMIERFAPRSHPIIDPVAERFGWLADMRRQSYPPTVIAVLDRREDLAYLDGLRRQSHPDHTAYAALSRPGGPGLGAKLERLTDYTSIRRLYDIINLQRWRIREELDPQAMAWWDEYFAKPRFHISAPFAIGGIILLTPVFAVLLWSAMGPDPGAGVFLLAFGWAVFATVGAAAAKVWLINPFGNQLARQVGWGGLWGAALMALVAALILTTALSSRGSILIKVCGFAALVLASGSFSVAEHQGWSKLHFLRKALASSFFLFLWWFCFLALAPSPKGFLMGFVLIGVSLFFTACEDFLSDYWEAHNAPVRRIILRGAWLSIAAATVAGLASLHDAPQFTFAVAAGVMILSLYQSLSDRMLSVEALTCRYVGMILATFILLTRSSDFIGVFAGMNDNAGAIFMLGAICLLGGAAFTFVAALWAEYNGPRLYLTRYFALLSPPGASGPLESWRIKAAVGVGLIGVLVIIALVLATSGG